MAYVETLVKLYHQNEDLVLNILKRIEIGKVWCEMLTRNPL